MDNIQTRIYTQKPNLHGKRTNWLKLLQEEASSQGGSYWEEDVDDTWEYAWDYVFMLMEDFDLEAYLQADPSSTSYSNGPIPLETYIKLERSFDPRNPDEQAEFDFCLFESTNEALLEFANKDSPVGKSTQIE